MPQIFEHDANATLDYTIDWSAWLDAGDTISTSVWAVESGDVTLATPTINGDLTQIWASAGTVGTAATVRNRITTAAGRIDDRTLTLVIRER